MKVSEQEIFDALTLYHKNDWKNGQYRGDGIQIGGSDFGLKILQNFFETSFINISFSTSRALWAQGA